jgi:soluble lytic murein transglycosylase-like protein
MQVMPFWVKLIGGRNDNLFHLRMNLRYGCTILKHYLDIEKGDLFRALGRYNGSLGRASRSGTCCLGIPPDAVRAGDLGKDSGTTVLSQQLHRFIAESRQKGPRQ